MSNVPFAPRNRAGRKLDALARRQIPDNYDLRAAVHRALSARNGSTAPLPTDWTRPVLDTRRRVPTTPPTPADNESDATMQSPPSDGTPGDIPIPLQPRPWGKEIWKIAAAILAFAIIGTLLVLVLRGGGNGKHSSVPGAGPTGDTPTATMPATATSVAAAASPTRDFRAEAHASQTALAAERNATAAASQTTAANLPNPGNIIATVAVGAVPGFLAATDGALWVANIEDGTLSRIDPATNTVVATVTVGPSGGIGGNGVPLWLVAYEGQLWTTNGADEQIVRVDPATNTVAQTIPMLVGTTTDAPRPGGLTVDSSGVWASDHDGGHLVHFDAATGAVLAELPVDQPGSLASGYGSIWVVSGQGGRLITRVDPVTNTVVGEIPVTGNVWVMQIVDDAVWCIGGDGDLFRIDPATNTLTQTIDTGLPSSHGSLITAAGIWVGGNLHDGLVRIDPATGEHSRVIDLDNGNVTSAIEYDGSVWVAHPFSNVVVRIEPTP
jgi:YVTN family beta-propeller protein